MVNKSGERLHKTVRLRIFAVENKSSVVKTYRAGPGKGFTSEGIETLLTQTADDLEKKYPDEEFSLVPVGVAHFNFVWRGFKDGPELTAGQMLLRDLEAGKKQSEA